MWFPWVDVSLVVFVGCVAVFIIFFQLGLLVITLRLLVRVWGVLVLCVAVALLG